MRYATLFLLSLAVACGGGDISVRQRFLAQSEVSVQFDAWVRSFNNQDQDSLALFYHHVPELRVLSVDGTISLGWEQERDNQREFFEVAQLVNFVPGEPDIEVITRKIVITTFRHTLDVERVNGQRDPTIRGLGTVLWTLDPNEATWKIRLLHLSARPPSGGLDL